MSNRKDKNVPRYFRGDEVILAGLKHTPAATVILDQPRSDNRVWVREDESGLRRHMVANDLVGRAEWAAMRRATETEAKPAPPLDNPALESLRLQEQMIADFRAALVDYISINPAPPAGSGRRSYNRAMYEHAMQAVPAARPYIAASDHYQSALLNRVNSDSLPPNLEDEARVGRLMRAIGAGLIKTATKTYLPQEKKVKSKAVSPLPASAGGVVLNKDGSVRKKMGGRPKVKAVEEVAETEALTATETLARLKAELDKPKSERWTPTAVQDLTISRVIDWVKEQAKPESSAFLPTLEFMAFFLGMTQARWNTAQDALEKEGYQFVQAHAGLGWWVLPPVDRKAILRQAIGKATLEELRTALLEAIDV